MSPQSERRPRACEECLDLGWKWVRLRQCTECGHVGCCDSSRGHHAYRHHATTAHPVVISLASDEEWAWCYVDELFLVKAPSSGDGTV
ncbi:UBP-type zinc finger domain-containing protein [Streptomyces sp. NPDC090127]|uniref:UBP-type zinc finger domain-containing protein n=1 Tax=Streptomyces sp. NPDC090127 TaxID=3365953 RepID=UPI003826C2F2